MLCYIFYGDRIIIIAAASLPDCRFSIPKYVFFKNVTSKKNYFSKQFTSHRRSRRFRATMTTLPSVAGVLTWRHLRPRRCGKTTKTSLKRHSQIFFLLIKIESKFLYFCRIIATPYFLVRTRATYQWLFFISY